MKKARQGLNGFQPSVVHPGQWNHALSFRMDIGLTVYEAFAEKGQYPSFCSFYFRIPFPWLWRIPHQLTAGRFFFHGFLRNKRA
jgi:hypothetical protein